jgi:hypothetical protein
MKDITIGELVSFIKKNRRGNAFKDYSDDRIVQQILHGIKHATMCYSVDKNNNLTGVACGRKDDVKKVFFVDDVLTTTHSAVKDLLAMFLKFYPDYTLTGIRHAKQFRTFKQPINILQRL